MKPLSLRSDVGTVALVTLALAGCFQALGREAEAGAPPTSPSPASPYPPTPFVVDVTQAPYQAKGDGVTDDTEAVQRAINDVTGLQKALLFPPGTYLVTRTLRWPKRWNDRENWGKTLLRGSHRDRSILRLKDGTFPDASRPGAMMWCGGFGSADWFHNYVEDLTFDVGTNNPGAIALQFYSNNSGAIRNCRFVAGAGSGLIGLDLAHRDMNGPLLVRNCEVVGFRRGVVTGHAVNSQTFENLSLRGQTEFGFDNAGQTVSVRGLFSDNAVPAVRTYGLFTLLEAQAVGRAGASQIPALLNYNGGRLWVRDLKTTGYGRALGAVPSPDFSAALRVQGPDHAGSAGPDIAEYRSHPPTTLFAARTNSLRLPVEETPDPPFDAPADWANVDQFGADPTGQRDSSSAIQKAIDSGARTIFLPGSYNLRATVVIRGRVARLVGLGGTINYGVGLRPDFRLADGDAPMVFLEHLSHVDGGLELDSRRTLVLRSVSDCNLLSTPNAEGGEIFLEDVVTHDLRLRRQRVWARQLNIENEGTHLVNQASDVWILGYKTERGGTLLDTRSGGRSEVLGGFSYTTTAGRLAPMFRIEDASLFAFFAEVCFNGDPFRTLAEETRAGQTRRLARGEGHTTPYIAAPPAPAVPR